MNPTPSGPSASPAPEPEPWKAIAMPRRSGKRVLSMEMAAGCQSEAATPAMATKATSAQYQCERPASIMQAAAASSDPGSRMFQWSRRRSVT